MKKIYSKMIVTAVVAMGISSATLSANASDEFKSIEPPAGHPLDEIISGYEFRSEQTQALQDDDFENPGFLWVERGEELWNTVDGEAGKSCASCHNDASDSMKLVGSTFPKWDKDAQKPINFENQVNKCRTEQMQAKKWKYDSEQSLSMVTYLRHQSQGAPMNVDISGPMKSWYEKGEELYNTRVGQLDMACSNCHTDNYGNYIRSDHLSQGQSNGFPVYRLKWQGMGSLHRRFKGCMKNIRATPYEKNSDEFLALEVFVARRGHGLPVETPSVRN